jgi:hypothetical protein
MTDAQRHPAVPSPGWPDEAKDWSEGLHEFAVARFGIVQTAARFWLGTMTTLVALFSALIVVNRGESLAELPVATPVRVLLYIVVVIVYGCALGAVIRGSQACFGGLSVRTGDKDDGKGFRNSVVEQWHPRAMPDPATIKWQDFRDDRKERGDDARRFLHQSRALGVGAVLFGVVLALLVLALGGFADDTSDPTHVVVVHDGQVTCGALDRDNGRTLIGGQEIRGVSQLTTVESC